MKQVFAVVVVLCLAQVAWADRAPYTSELVEGAVLIGVWRSRNLKSNGEDIQLKRPDTVLKGEFAGIGKAKRYSPRLKRAIQRIEKEGPFILFVRLHGERADLVSSSGRLHYNATTLKAVRAVIRQLDLKEKWKTLSVEEQIERSDLIVTGQITEGTEYPRSYSMSADKVYRGVPPRTLSLIPVPKEQLGVESLLFVQRYNGSGPDYIVMHAVPLKDAKEYLKQLEETRISQQKNPPDKK